MELREEHRRQKIAKELQTAIGHAPIDMKEKRVHGAATAVLAGDAPSDACRMFAVHQQEIVNYMNRAFPDDTDRFKFLEECALSNAIIAQGHFMQTYKEMTPEGAARAFGIFADKAIALKKARESGFQEAPVNVAVLINLQETLAKIVPAT